ncbi:MAG: hypothetical protein NC517_07435, partial [Firmicutes bacterium]|nr:hypothetical protein [Bacillota bacterium]
DSTLDMRIYSSGYCVKSNLIYKAGLPHLHKNLTIARNKGKIKEKARHKVNFVDLAHCSRE